MAVRLGGNEGAEDAVLDGRWRSCWVGGALALAVLSSGVNNVAKWASCTARLERATGGGCVVEVAKSDVGSGAIVLVEDVGRACGAAAGPVGDVEKPVPGKGPRGLKGQGLSGEKTQDSVSESRLGTW